MKEIIEKSFKKYVIFLVAFFVIGFGLRLVAPVDSQTDFIKGFAVYAACDIISLLWIKMNWPNED